MNLQFTAAAWEDYCYWQTADPHLTERINLLLIDARRDPFRGRGKPEPLRGEFAGWWSRRISREHRLIYRCVGKGSEQRLEIIQCRDHY